MSCRSDVKLCISNESFNKIKDLDIINCADDINVRRADRITISWNFIEWNENIPRIKELMDILKEKKFSYNFIRVGEESIRLDKGNNDIEKRMCITAEKDRNIFYGLRIITTIKEDSEALYIKRMKRILENCRQE